MDKVLILQPDSLGKDFIPRAFIPEGKDEHHLRNKQMRAPASGWRHLRADEVECLIKNDNTSSNWDEVLVSDPFDPQQIANSRFFGLVRIGRLRNIVLQHHDLRLPSGITNSLIIACDIGDDVAIHNVHYLAHYIIGNQTILFNIDEMHVTDHAKFGNGILKEGEPEQVRTWLDLMNEAGCRQVLPFDGMTSADAYLWAKYIDDKALQEKLKEITQNSVDNHRGVYGTTGSHSVIKNSLILKDVKIGSHCYIKGANKLKNLTINSSEKGPTQIGEGVELVNGIIGYGCRIFYGCKAVKFVMGNNSSLKYGARLINSYLGDNSTISCCEVLNNLLFPAHEQHHNNSFLVAAVVMGQSNMAAGATIGSNHNSRANDNEVQAGRGFWPGLCASVKHSSRFASFVLLSKADYPSELDIPLPFSLLSNNVSKDQLEVLPAYWWLYNMYALARNAWKYLQRDNRSHAVQHIEFDPLAPDTVEECITARSLLETWVGTAAASYNNIQTDTARTYHNSLSEIGRQWLLGPEEAVDKLEVLGEEMEHSKRKVVIIKAYKAYHAYGDMLHYYAIKNLLEYLEAHPDAGFAGMCEALRSERQREWVNLGGQLMQKGDVDVLRADIGNGTLTSWEAIHKRYDTIWKHYPRHKQQHAYALWCQLLGTDVPTATQWSQALDRAVSIQLAIKDQVYLTRKKDYDNPYSKATFRNEEERNAAVGTIDDNPFIVQVIKETEAFVERCRR